MNKKLNDWSSSIFQSNDLKNDWSIISNFLPMYQDIILMAFKGRHICHN